MGKLVPEALYTNNMIIVDDPWRRAAKRIKEIDPNGDISYALLKMNGLEYDGRGDRIRAKKTKLYLLTN